MSRSATDRQRNSSETAAREGHTPASLADVLERDYFPMPEGAKLYLAEGEWRMVIAALRAQGSERQEIEHLRMQIGYIVTELMVRGDPRSLPEIVETAAKATKQRDERPRDSQEKP